MVSLALYPHRVISQPSEGPSRFVAVPTLGINALLCLALSTTVAFSLIDAPKPTPLTLRQPLWLGSWRAKANQLEREDTHCERLEAVIMQLPRQTISAFPKGFLQGTLVTQKVLNGPFLCSS
jgi:hypothetical protein